MMAWVIQRATSVYLLVMLSYLLIHFIFDAPADHAALVGWASQPLVAMALLLLVPVVLMHAWVGIRDVLIDYVHVLGLRITLLSLFAFVFVASGLWAFKAIIIASLQG
jgi:succinate dehydrogenase / fumarate reductase membrane anchor subunit